MAESELGTAKLKLTVDINAFRASLREAKTLVSDELGGVASTGSRRRTTGSVQGGSGTTGRRSGVIRGDTSLPVSGRLINGRLVPESPAALDRSARIGGPSLPVSGRLINGGLAPGSPAALQAQVTAERRLQRERERTARVTIKAAEREVQAQQKRRKDAFSSALIGGAFPLLFGQGAGASIGGLLGGGVGGFAGGGLGFGLSLVGTAIGAQIDALNKRITDLGKALQSPVESFSQIVEASVLASNAQESYVQALIDSGRTALAATQIQNEAFKTIDPANALLLVASTDELNRAWSDLQDELGSFTAGAGQAFLSWLADVIRSASGAPGARGGSLTGPEARRNAENQQFTGLTLGSIGLALGIGAATFATGGVALAGIAAGAGVAGLGFGSAIGANDKKRVANSEEVRQKEAEIQELLSRQIGTQNAIAEAQRRGLAVAAESFKISSQIQAVNLTAANAELQVSVALAAGKIDQAEAAQQLQQIEAARSTQLGKIVAQEQAAAAAAQQGLVVTEALAGKKGAALEIARQQVELAKAQYEYDQASAALAVAQKNPNTSQEEKDALTAKVDAAGAKLKQAGIDAGGAIFKAVEQSADKLKQAAEAFQSTSEGNFKFLSRTARDRVLTQARADIGRGVQSGEINSRFLGSNKPDTLIAAAAASRSQLQALENLGKAQSEYADALQQSSANFSSVFKESTGVLEEKFQSLNDTIGNLVNKNWAVNVTVTGDSKANVRVD